MREQLLYDSGRNRGANALRSVKEWHNDRKLFFKVVVSLNMPFQILSALGEL